MPLTESIRIRLIKQYCIIFLIIIIYKYFTKGFLFQLPPFFFYNKLDFTTWLVMLTGVHRAFLNNFTLCFISDVLFCSLPFIYFFAYLKSKKLASIIGFIICIVNITYAVIYCSFPTDSLENHIALILFPVVFTALTLNTFWFLINGLRYFFLFFFASAGIWKIWQGGIFDFQQMSAILIYQHKEFLISSSPSSLVLFYKWLIVHPFVSYSLYLCNSIVELFFLAGFFTKRWDRLLILLYILFLIANAIVMKIHYWETVPFLLALYYSKYEMPTRL